MAELLATQLDYIYFTYGFALILLGAVCVGGFRSGPLPTPWWLVGLFGLAYGVGEWFELLALAGGDGPGFLLARGAVRAASFLYLLEFARRTNAILLRATPGRWIHPALVLVVVGLCLGWGWRHLDSASRLLLGAPAVFWTAGLFLVAARRTSALGGGPSARRARAWGAFWLAAFGVLGTLMVRGAPFLPPGWPTAEAFRGVAGFPVQVARSVAVLGMTASLWALALAFDALGPVLRKKRILFWVTSSALVVLLAGGWTFTNLLGRLHDEETTADASTAAARMADHVLQEMEGVDDRARTLASMAGRLRLDPARAADRDRLGNLADALVLEDPDRTVYVLDATGRAVAASSRAGPASQVGQDFSARTWFRDAMAGRHGRFIGLGLSTGVPGYCGSEPIRDASGRVAGVVVAKHALGPAQLGPHSAERAYLVSPDGRILISSEDGRRGAPLWPPDGAQWVAVGDPVPPVASDRPLLERKVDGPQWVTLDGARLLALRHPLPGTDGSIVVLRRETSKVVNRLLGIAITLLVGLVMLASFVALQRQFGTESTLVFEKAEVEDRARVLARQADTDALTGVMNRLGFNAEISREVAHARRYRQPLSLLIMDLDHFKRVNDEHGHPAGDQVLVSTARLLESHLRESDTLARWGGEEFVIVAPMTAAEGCMQLGEKLRGLMASTPIGPRGPITASIGVAELQAGETIESLLQRADGALYRAKAGGRNRVERAGAQERAVERVPEREAGAGAGPDGPVPGPYPTTGFAPIDEDHRDVERRVATLVAHVHAGRVDGARQALRDLEAAAVAHFAHEEAFMARFRYPERARHGEAHASFLADAARSRKELEADGLIPRVRRWAAGRLPEWFRFHVLCHDTALAAFLQGEKEAPRPPSVAAGTETETA